MAAEPPIVVVSGHMVDAPDRPGPRFPPDQVPRMTSEIRQALARWGVGSGTTVVADGARGADIIASEQALGLGARLHLCLARSKPTSSKRRSVAVRDTEWSARAPEAHQRLRKLDSVEAMDDLQTVGGRLAAGVDVETHFAGFL